MTTTGSGTKHDPWILKTPPGTSEFQMYRDDDADPAELVCVPPLFERLGLVELEHNPRSNRVRAA